MQSSQCAHARPLAIQIFSSRARALTRAPRQFSAVKQVGPCCHTAHSLAATSHLVPLLVPVPHCVPSAWREALKLSDALSHVTYGIQLVTEVPFDEVGERRVRAAVSDLVHFEQLLVHEYLQLERFRHSFAEIRLRGIACEVLLGNVNLLQSNLPTAGVLVLDELLGVPDLRRISQNNSGSDFELQWGGELRKLAVST